MRSLRLAYPLPPAPRSKVLRSSLLLAWAAANLLLGCDFYPPVKKQGDLMTLNVPTAPRQSPDCAQCHQYPLKDVHHAYHLLAHNTQHGQVENAKLNGPITCMDCHFNSVHHFTYTGYDTLWVDANNNPIDGPELPTDRISSINPITLFRPVPAETPLEAIPGGPETQARAIDRMTEHALSLGEVLEWMTGSTHQNGHVDVSFPPNNALYPESLGVMFRPRDLSCSMVACHQNGDRYRWADPSRGMGSCPSLNADDSTCLQPQPGEP